jgi:glycogen(starch) synthase
MIAKKADMVMEISWEICNKVGGIYTVIKSKAARTIEYYKDNYILIGPYFADKARGEFQEELPEGALKQIFDELKQENIICHCGKWLIEGTPRVILMDFAGFRARTNDVKKDLWEAYKIDSMYAPPDYDEPVVWSYAVGKLIEKLVHLHSNKKIVAQFHEWLSGAGLLYLKKNRIRIATVFITHATILGRSMAGYNINPCTIMGVNPDSEAKKYGIQAKYQVEKQSAQQADIFSTVSEITALEAEKLLGRKPEVLVLNGLDISKFPSFEDGSIKHKLYKNQIKEFLMYYFFPYYLFDIEKTLIFFLAGRYEFHAKGIDILIKALGKLNQKLKSEKSDITIVTFIWVPTGIRGVKLELLENRIFFKDIKDSLDEEMDDIKRSMLTGLISNRNINQSDLFDKEFMSSIQKKIMNFKKQKEPFLVTHDLIDDNDAILQSFFENNLQNKEEDRVKMIYYPTYLSGADGLLDLEYYEAMTGGQLGIFPSFYEPWGYTPLEAGALGVASITTDLSGFGKYIVKQLRETEPGVYVIKRLHKNDEEAVQELVDIMHLYATYSKEQRVSNKIEARRLSMLADWKNFIENYIKAHNLAVDKAYP